MRLLVMVLGALTVLAIFLLASSRRAPRSFTRALPLENERRPCATPTSSTSAKCMNR